MKPKKNMKFQLLAAKMKILNSRKSLKFKMLPSQNNISQSQASSEVLNTLWPVITGTVINLKLLAQKNKCAPENPHFSVFAYPRKIQPKGMFV
jgi:hypothetical protein